MTDEAAERKRWEAAMLRNQYSNYRVDLQAQHEIQQQPNVGNEPIKENYTLLRDAYGCVVKVYGLNQNYELFNNSSSNQPQMPFLQNNINPVTASQPQPNYQANQRSYQQQEFYNENRIHYGGENSLSAASVPAQKAPGQGQNMQAMYSSNPIINQLVGNWTPGTSIYGDCFMNNNADENLQRSHEPHHQTYETTQNMANNQVTLNDSIENTMPTGVPPQLKKKQRIVAEVKPMRMSYSDVLSKNVLSETKTNSQNIACSNNVSQANNTNTQGNGKKKQNQARSPILFDKRPSVTVTADEKYRKTQNTSNGEKITKTSVDQKSSNPLAKETKGVANVAPTENKPKKSSKKNEKNAKNKTKGTQNTSKSTPSCEKFARDDDQYHLIPDDSNQDKDSESYDNMYSVNYDRISTKGMSQSSSYKKNKHSANLSSSGGRNASKQDSKFYSKRNQKNHKSHRYQMLEKFWIMWLEYVTKFVLWLWSLISDVVYLSFGIVWDFGYQHVNQFVVSMCSEIRSRPSIWIKSMWSKVMSKLEKWTFWQKIFMKRQEEPVKDYYKDGKLPTTADEAMYSLLNCKGKDAYSILGVMPDSPQEQIRKHFHKIALLVHPDKNKQIGSEEAFKVLQRSFELIGEPESRKQYDLSLAEALNAEKAWSELNDLLKQLHTKISEAANTIRCSSCCSRHPRKHTGRPHYAARECNSCRIKHSAREGDIWAETTFFGLRWRYLALMEGKVYDITEWANCQKGALSHLQPNSHIVQYRIVLGQNSQQQQQAQQEKEKFIKKEQSSGESTFDDILSNIYSGQKQSNTSRRKHKK